MPREDPSRRAEPLRVGVVRRGGFALLCRERRWGDRVCLAGNVSLVTLGRGTPEQVSAEAEGLVRDLGEGGGYMLSSSNSIASYVPAENALALGRAAAGQAATGDCGGEGR